MRQDREWWNAVLKLVSDLNNFNFDNPSKRSDHADSVSFYIARHKVGVVQRDVLEELTNFPDVFKILTGNSSKAVHLSETLSTVEARSDAFERVLQELRKKGKFVSLKGWRNECAGGLASGLGVKECAIKECQEEGSVDDETLKHLKSVGSISYSYVDERGIFPETQYVFDLELSTDFVPKNADGEMQSFNLYSIEQIQNLIIAGEFKPNCALVIVDFLIRHGYITPDDDPNYCYIMQRMHTLLQPSD